MKTKLFLILLAVVSSATISLAQDVAKGKTSLAILGGVNFQAINGKDFAGDKLESDLLTGFHAGINVQIPIAPEFYFQPGLMYSGKGAKSVNGSVTSDFNLSYLELPLNFVYKGAVGNGFVMLGFGPYVGYAIGGKATYTAGSIEVTDDIEFTNKVENGDAALTPYFKSMDFGGNIFFGFESAGGLFLQLNTQLGMAEINPEDNRIPNNKTSLKNTGFGLSLGYRL
jgi:hypothetical protein